MSPNSSETVGTAFFKPLISIRNILGTIKNFSSTNKQCDQIVAETPNRDVLGVQMSLIFGKCRLAFFVTFKPKRAFFLAFLIFGRFYPIFASFLKKIIQFSMKIINFHQKNSLRGIILQKVIANCRFHCSY